MVYVGRRGRKKAKKKARVSLRSVCLWVLVLAVGFMLAFPGEAKKLRRKASEALGMDLGGAVGAFGENLRAGENIFAAAKDAFRVAFTPGEDGEMQVLSGDDGAEPAMSGAPGADTLNNIENSVPTDPVELFKESQREFDALGLPSNVTYEKPEAGELSAPVEGTVTSGFGYREHPSDGQVRFHYGLDVAAEQGTDVVSAADGTVAAVGDSTSYGAYVIIRHDNGVESLYAHLAEIFVENGDQVLAGEKIGTVGDSGNATAPCLHLELLVNGDYVNPGYYLYL